MPKKRRHPRGRLPVAPVERGVELSEARALVERQQYAEARRVLDDLARRHPNRPEVLVEQVNLAVETADAPGFQRAAERLVLLRQEDPELLLALGASYLTTTHPSLARSTFRRFLDQWPGHSEAPLVRQTLARLENELPALLVDIGLTGGDALELGVLHEQVQQLLEAGEYAEARRVAERLLRQRPDFVPGLNNLSQLHALEGRLEEAIGAAQRVLVLDPMNFHALSNLTRYYCLAGRVEEVYGVAARLKGVTSAWGEVWTKKAEALSYLGDDTGVVEAFRGAEQAGVLKGDRADPLLYHWAAVAALRLGRRDEARRRWRRALKLAPGLEIAQENLDDLEKPVGEREGPWAFSLGQWLSQRAWRDLVAVMESFGSGEHAGAAERALRGFLRQHTEVSRVAPLLLERGDPVGRGFALRLALLVKTPELLGALREFALSQRGTDIERQEAAMAARAAGLLPFGPVRMWLEGDWREVIPLGFEINDEPIYRHSPPVERLGEEALRALRAGEGEQAERLLQEALRLDPGKPDLLNNLAAAYGIEGREEEAERLLRELHERHPDYFFARTGLAHLHVRRKEFKAAVALLDPLLNRERYHISEFATMCEVRVALYEAQGQDEAAQTWLDLWAGVDPDNPKLERWKLLFRLRGGLGRLAGRRRRR